MNRFIECLFKLENAFKSKYAKITNQLQIILLIFIFLLVFLNKFFFFHPQYNLFNFYPYYTKQFSIINLHILLLIFHHTVFLLFFLPITTPIIIILQILIKFFINLLLFLILHNPLLLNLLLLNSNYNQVNFHIIFQLFHILIYKYQEEFQQLQSSEKAMKYQCLSGYFDFIQWSFSFHFFEGFFLVIETVFFILIVIIRVIQEINSGKVLVVFLIHLKTIIQLLWIFINFQGLLKLRVIKTSKKEILLLIDFLSIISVISF